MQTSVVPTGAGEQQQLAFYREHHQLCIGAPHYQMQGKLALIHGSRGRHRRAAPRGRPWLEDAPLEESFPLAVVEPRRSRWSHPLSLNRIREQFRSPYGSGPVSGKAVALVSFGLRDGENAPARFMAALQMIALATGVGGNRTTICHPYPSTHAGLSEVQKAAAVIRPEVLRLCVGNEDPADILEDLERGFSGLYAGGWDAA